MGRVVLDGLDGASPLGFLAALGLLRVVDGGRLAWTTGHRAALVGPGEAEIVKAVVADAARWADGGPMRDWRYLKQEKNGVKEVRSLRPPVSVFRAWAIARMADGDADALAYAAALVVESAVEALDPKKDVTAEEYASSGIALEPQASLRHAVAPTFFDFTSRNAQFLGQVERIRQEVTPETVAEALTGQVPSVRCTVTMGWDPSQDAPGALFPRGGPGFRPALEWLAFRGLPLLPSFHDRRGVSTTGCSGRRKAGTFEWPLWDPPVSARVVGSLLARPDLVRLGAADRSAIGVFQVFRAELKKSADGYDGIFSPSEPT